MLSNFYNQTRAEYYRQLDLASKKPSGPIDFLHYALRGLRDALDEQIKDIRRYQWDVVWRDYVYQKFGGMEGGAAKRRRLVALELAKANPCRVLPSGLRRLTPEIAELYADKTGKTLTRDLHALEAMKLVRRVGRLVEANGSILTKLLPKRRPQEPVAPQGDEGVILP